MLGNLDLRRIRVFTPRLDHRRLLLRRLPMPATIVLRPSVKTMSLRSATRQTVEWLYLPRLFAGDPRDMWPSAQQKEAIRRRAQGATLDELARSYKVNRATISRLAM